LALALRTVVHAPDLAPRATPDRRDSFDVSLANRQRGPSRDREIGGG
jgi:hypothetical protein